MLNQLFLGLAVVLSTFSTARADDAETQVIPLRWTGAQDADGTFDHVLAKLNADAGLKLTKDDFLLFEDRDLARTHFTMYVQTVSGVPVSGSNLRIWNSRYDGKAVQVEAFLTAPKIQERLLLRARKLGAGSARGFALSRSVNAMIPAVRATVAKNPDDRVIGDVRWTEQWRSGDLVREFQGKGRRGKHFVSVALATDKVVGYRYEPFPQAANSALREADNGKEYSLDVEVFPVYEETYTTMEPQHRVKAELRYLSKKAVYATEDPFAELKKRDYYFPQWDPVLGETEIGREKGFWASSWLKRQGAQIRAQLPLMPNEVSNAPGGAILAGRYATINLNPGAKEKFPGLKFEPRHAGQLYFIWGEGVFQGQPAGKIIPVDGLLGKPVESAEELASRPAIRRPDHDPAAYINDGFDEIQVYWAITRLMESLRSMGFTDPDLSTRAFNAFMYDPDITMRDNAYYTDDTINFTTYSPNQGNMARDNPTIWHELGHGIMDRLMGDTITLADTGGLSEGMADYVAYLVTKDVTDLQPYPGESDMRIINQIGFHLTNEVHDDGEAYGGSMRDMADLAIAKWGRPGLVKITDLTLEAMRLSRNHPALTAKDWFDHVLFADELGNPGIRAAGELHELIIQALAGRNYSFDGSPGASLTVMNGEEELTSESPGARENPIRLQLKASEKKEYTLSVKLQDSEHYKFRYPAQILVEYKRGALQGAVDWEGEDGQPQLYTINGPGESVPVRVAANGACDYANRDDGSCVDYAYLQIRNQGDTDRPVAKKRFYLRIKTVE
jgi:hypothetical protein